MKIQAKKIHKYGVLPDEYKRQIVDGNRWCYYQKHFAPSADFYGPTHGMCKTCFNIRRNLFYKAMPADKKATFLLQCKVRNSETAADRRKWALKKNYGVTPEWFKAKLEEQGGHCALCPTVIDGKRKKFLDVDHDHNCCTGRKSCGKCVRGLLCIRCNCSISQMEKFPDWPERARKYFESYSQRRI